MLPRFRTIGDQLMKRYWKSRQVVPIHGRRARKPIFLKLKRSKRPDKKPRRKDLVYIQRSPNYCDRNRRAGSTGTKGRACNRTSNSYDSCSLLCCGRGFNTQQEMKTWQCKCKFHWCCHVTCHKCQRLVEQYTCK